MAKLIVNNLELDSKMDFGAISKKIKDVSDLYNMDYTTEDGDETKEVKILNFLSELCGHAVKLIGSDLEDEDGVPNNVDFIAAVSRGISIIGVEKVASKLESSPTRPLKLHTFHNHKHTNKVDPLLASTLPTTTTPVIKTDFVIDARVTPTSNTTGATPNLVEKAKLEDLYEKLVNTLKADASNEHKHVIKSLKDIGTTLDDQIIALNLPPTNKAKEILDKFKELVSSTKDEDVETKLAELAETPTTGGKSKLDELTAALSELAKFTGAAPTTEQAAAKTLLEKITTLELSDKFDVIQTFKKSPYNQTVDAAGNVTLSGGVGSRKVSVTISNGGLPVCFDASTPRSIEAGTNIALATLKERSLPPLIKNGPDDIDKIVAILARDKEIKISKEYLDRVKAADPVKFEANKAILEEREFKTAAKKKIDYI